MAQKRIERNLTRDSSQCFFLVLLEFQSLVISSDEKSIFGFSFLIHIVALEMKYFLIRFVSYVIIKFQSIYRRLSQLGQVCMHFQ